MDRRAALVPRRRRRHRQPLLVRAPTAATCAATPITTPTTRGRRRATARASSTPARRACGCSIRPTGARASWRSRRQRIGRRRRAASSPPAEHLESFRVHPAGHSLAARRARPAVRDAALGRRGHAAQRRGRSDRRERRRRRDAGDASAPRPVARRRHDDGRGQRRLGRGAPGRFRGQRRRRARCRGTPATSRRSSPRRRRARRLRQSSQRGLDRRRRQRRARRRRPQRLRPQRRPRLVARWRMARLHLRHRHAPRRAQAALARRRHRHPGSPSPSSATRRRRSTPKAATCTSSRCGPSIRSTTTSASTSAFRAAARPYLIALQARRPAAVRSGAAPGRRRRERRGRRKRPRPRRHRCASISTASPRASQPSRSPKDATAGSPASPAPRCVWNAARRSSARTGAAATRKRQASSSASTSRPGAPRRSPRRSTTSRSPPTAATLVYRDGKTLRAIAADRKRRARKPEPADADGPPSRKNGRIDLERVRVAIEPRASGGRCCARSGACSATSSGRPTCPGVDWNAV